MSTSTRSAACTSLVELLSWRAAEQANQLACTFLVDGESQSVSLTYGELDRHARAIAARLQEMRPQGARVLLLYSPGLEFITAFFGCLYAGAIAVPVYPPHRSNLARALPKLLSITRDAQPIAALTSAANLPMGQELAESAPELGALPWIATDALGEADAAAWREPPISAQTIAFLQYTSGSTSSPKGVMVSHGNLLHNEDMVRQAFEYNEQSLMVSWLPLYHDMGLIGTVLQPLFTGFPCVLMSPMNFLQRHLRWLTAITRYRATSSGAPNFAYDLCVRKVKPEQLATLDLSTWRVAFNGAEPIHAATLRRFAETFAPCGFRYESFYPCYGLAEATLFVTGGAVDQPPIIQHVQAAPLEQDRVVISDEGAAGSHPLVSCGYGHAGQAVVIVHPETCTRVAGDQVGEIWVSGPSVAQGYWGKSEESADTFQAYLSDTKEGPFLRTGDLGFIHDGQVFVTGRRKDLIIISGRNHYPQDIELTVEQCHPAMRGGGCAAFTIIAGEQERLVVVAEVERRYRAAADEASANPSDDNSEAAKAITQAIRQAISAQHDLQVHEVALIRAGSLPKTSSGKVQRFACRASFLAGTLNLW